MRRALERFAWRMWRGEAGVPGRVVSFLLLPLEGVWRLAARRRNHRFDVHDPPKLDGLTVISVGNVAVGGTGKTPISAWVASVLEEFGHRPAVLLRGYGQDEVELHSRWSPGREVVVTADRASGARVARSKGCDVAVLDDGFQHRGVGRALDIVLLAATDPVPGAVLPRGPYREPLSALKRADAVVVTRRDTPRSVAESRLDDLRGRGCLAPGFTTAGVRLTSDRAVPLGAWVDGVTDEEGAWVDGISDEEGAWDASRGAVAFTAIARPEGFRADVEELTGASTELVAYPDHHVFSTEDVRRLRGVAGERPVFVTEKDAVKLTQSTAALGEAWVVLQRVDWEWGEEELRSRLRAVMARGMEGA